MDKSSAMKKATVIQITPEKTEADRDAENFQLNILYDAECEQMDAEHDSKVLSLQHVIDVKATAWHRANDEFQASFARMNAASEVFDSSVFATDFAEYSARMAYNRLAKFSKQLCATADSLAKDYHKAVDVLDALEARFIEKHEKLYEKKSLAWVREGAAESPLITSL